MSKFVTCNIFGASPAKRFVIHDTLWPGDELFELILAREIKYEHGL